VNFNLKKRRKDMPTKWENYFTPYFKVDKDEEITLTGTIKFTNVDKYHYPIIDKIIYNMKNPEKPATIVYFTDGDKVVVKCTDKDTFTKENGVAMALIRKMMPNRSEFLRLVENGFVQE